MRVHLPSKGQTSMGCIGFFALAGLTFAQLEPDPKNQTDILDAMSQSDAVAVGKFRVHRCLPWFDGWHCVGAIHIEEPLHGNLKSDEGILFRWKEPYGSACQICEQVSRLDGEKGIWFVKKSNGIWQLSGTRAVWCGGPLPMDCYDTVLQCARQRRGK